MLKMLQLHQNGSINNGYTNCIARAMYDNIAEAPDELAFRKDDILTVLEQNTAGLEGWWLCSLRGRQGICPGNRLRLIPGVYEVTEPQIITTCIQDKNHLNHESKHQSWHANLNTVTSQQKLGDLLTYDTPQKTIDSNGYNIPPTNHILDRLTNGYTKRPLSIGSSSGCCSDSYDPLPNQHPLVSKESYDVPRPVNVQVTPSSSISSLSTGGICSSTSGSESNRSSSIGLDYDVPRNRTLLSLQSEFQNLTISSQDYDVPSNSLQPKELSIDLNRALECLDKLTSEVSSNTTQLLNYAGPNWRSQKNLEANLLDIKIISLRLKNSLRQYIEFSEGCLGNAVNARDKGISTKLQPLVFDLIKTDKMICYSTNALDCLDWKPQVLYRELNNECEYSEDALDKLISCAKLLTDDIRQVTSFIKGNSTLLFKKEIISTNDEEDDDYEYIGDENGKRPSINSASIKNDSSSSEISTKDKKIFNYYSHQIVSQTDLLTSHINTFLQIVKENRPPPVFVMKVKYIILIAHQLVVVGDTICRNVQESTVKNHVEQCTKALSADFIEEDMIVNDNLAISGSQVADTDLCLNKMSHLAQEFKQCYDYTKTSLTNIKFDIKNLVYTVNEIKSMVEHAVNVLNTSGSLISNQDNHSNLLNTENVPISNKQTLENVETELENATTRSQVVNELSRLVGRSISDSVRRMMQKLFDDTWLKYYSYIGHKGKNKLSSLNSCKIIFDAIHLCSKFEKVLDIEIALSISKWMAQASNRLKKKCTNSESINNTL